ncbi:MAG: 4Fe-4S binding protein [Lachnospiraceae bacterium]|nr:4Fe-4S binding protein [Lachnospiraceae bacterium]
MNKLRTIVQAISFAFSNGYVNGWIRGKIYTGNTKKICLPGLNCYSCPGAIYACPIGSLQAVFGARGYKFSLYVLGFIGLIGMFFGRLICGWICPFGFIQDLLYKIPLFKKKKNLPGHNVLKYLKYVVLMVFVILLPLLLIDKSGTGAPWFCEYICPDGTLIAGIPLAIANAEIRSAIGWRFYLKLAILLAVIVSAIKAYRPFCKYLCPLGALYSIANPISLYRYEVNNEKCVKCGLCQEACGMDIKVYETPNSPECIRCGKCKNVCPKGAIVSSLDKLKEKVVEE